MLYKTPAQGVCHGFGFYPIHSRSLTGAALRQAHRGSLRLLDSLLYPFSQQGTPLNTGWWGDKAISWVSGTEAQWSKGLEQLYCSSPLTCKTLTDRKCDFPAVIGVNSWPSYRGINKGAYFVAIYFRQPPRWVISSAPAKPDASQIKQKRGQVYFHAVSV